MASLFASGGADGSEGQLFALTRIATDPLIGFRAGSTRVVVWFGDAPGHDPICSAISGEAADITEATTIAALQAAGIRVVAISTLTGFPNGLDDNPAANAGNYLAACGAVGGAAGQATRIAAATGGAHLTGVASGDIAAKILEGIASVTVDVSAHAVGCDPLVISWAPATHFDVQGPTTVDFLETIAVPDGTLPGEIHCTVVFTADGAELARQTIWATVTSGEPGVDERFMTGGGNIAVGRGKNAERSTWGFEIRCDASHGHFQYNDHSTGDNFHLESITSVTCTDSGGDPSPPDASFDTLTLVGVGRLNGVSGSTVDVTLTDAGEPGKDVDSIDLDIDGGTLTLVGVLSGGNHQAHK
ncbi:MAG: hypothetical protein O3B95_03290 [Chloroflexi bacterium]|nr:hypothetical protein [Chloroflexota bacterium]